MNSSIRSALKPVQLLSILLFILMAFNIEPRLTVTSTVFADNKMIPSKYSCQGAEVSPPLKVVGMPNGTRSLAITVHDPDAPEPGGVTHWVAWNLPADGNIPENYNGGVQGLNSDNKPGYKGMCPPTGTHHYNFVVYALDTLLTISSNTDKAGLEKAIQSHILATGELTGLYAKTK